MTDFEHEIDPYFLGRFEKDLSTLQPEMRVAIDETCQLIVLARTMLVDLRVRNVDANNIVALVELLYQRSDQNAK